MTESLIDKFRTFPDNDGCDTITCKEKYKQQIISNEEFYNDFHKGYSMRPTYEIIEKKLSDYEDGIIKCPLCNKLEITVYGDDEYFPNLECNNCNMKWLCNGTGNDTLINEIEKYQTLKSGLEEIINQTEFEDADEATANLLVFPKLRKLLEKVK